MDLATIERLDSQGWKVDSLYLDTRHGTFSLHTTRFANQVSVYRCHSSGTGVQVETVVAPTDGRTLEQALARIDARIAELDTIACAGKGSSTCAIAGITEARS
jgi:hypothetical protein